ncbi:hypothetical protein FNAPI_974 [Fusarium napiforme]|uniref:Uncharacterized protein n=1 Tax=Fusarium napiforme TaxID=42672 RepID=A0A8H5K2Y9_9HYPO|nr:hypothetical protein FNAPI_974 [Fusarium napiforme]
MPPLKGFKNKREIDAEIRTTESRIETVTKLKEGENSEAIVQYWLKLAAECIVTSDPVEYDNTEKAAAQQQYHEYEDKEQRALNEKEKFERHLGELKERLKDLRKFRDEWTD